MTPECPTCKYSAWCLPKEFGSSEPFGNHRALVCLTCRRVAGVADIGDVGGLGTTVNATMGNTEGVDMIRPCEIRPENVVYVSKCCACIPVGEHERVEMSLTTERGTHHVSPTQAIQGRRRKT